MEIEKNCDFRLKIASKREGKIPFSEDDPAENRIKIC